MGPSDARGHPSAGHGSTEPRSPWLTVDHHHPQQSPGPSRRSAAAASHGIPCQAQAGGCKQALAAPKRSNFMDGLQYQCLWYCPIATSHAPDPDASFWLEGAAGCEPGRTRGRFDPEISTTVDSGCGTRVRTCRQPHVDGSNRRQGRRRRQVGQIGARWWQIARREHPRAAG